MRDITQGNKQIRRAERELELGSKQQVLPDKRYGVLLADPPWSFRVFSDATGMDRAAANHYPTMSTEAIARLAPVLPAADDCVLPSFGRPRATMLLDALSVITAWGFNYKSHFVWVKDRVGTGYWVRSRHELLLIGTKGNIPAPAPGGQYESVITAPRGEHSAKPFVVHEMIEENVSNTAEVGNVRAWLCN